MLFGALENVRGIHLWLLIGWKKIFVSLLCIEVYFTKLKQTLLSSIACFVERFRIGCEVRQPGSWLMAKQVPLWCLCWQGEFGTCYISWPWFRIIQGSNFSLAIWHKNERVAELYIPCIVVVPDVQTSVFFLVSIQSRGTARKWALYLCYSWRFWGSAVSGGFMFFHWFQEKLICFSWA